MLILDPFDYFLYEVLFSVFLKDAFEDLRTGNVEQLEALELKMKEFLKV